MKRDMDLVREILIAVEEGNLALNGLGYDRDQIHLHVELMEERGLVEAVIVRAADGAEHRIIKCSVGGLTRKGDNFLGKVVISPYRSRQRRNAWKGPVALRSNC